MSGERDRQLTREELRVWLDRPAPKGTWRDFVPEAEGPRDERSWEEFELARAADPQGEAGHG